MTWTVALYSHELALRDRKRDRALNCDNTHDAPAHQAKVTELEEGWLCAGDEYVGRLHVPVHHLA